MSSTEKAEHTAFLADVGRGLAELHTEYYGKGPSKARTYMLNDTLLCLLEGGFTTVERTLIADGNSEAVHEIRRSFQQAMEEQFTAVVEGSTGRKVIAYMSQIHQDPDLAVEIFVLEPSEDSAVGMHEQDLAGEDPRS